MTPEPSHLNLIHELRQSLILPSPKILSEWSENHIELSPEYSSRTGPLHLFGWQRAIFDSFTDPSVQEIVVMTGTQLIKSLFIMCAIAFVIAEDPGPILLVEPKDDAAKQFSKRRLSSLTRDCPILRGKISESKSDGNTILSKEFPGGNLLIVSARTPADLAQHTIRYLFCDEVDKYTADVGGSAEKGGGEGDPIELAWRRAMTFGSRRKLVVACSPTTAGISRISREFDKSDQCRPWVPCPVCGTRQVLRMRTKRDYHVRWDTSISRDLQPATARYHCINPRCDHPWTEYERWDAADNLVEWRPDRPERTDNGIRGFWINHLYVPPTWKTVPDMAKEFLNAKDARPTLKTFVNTVLAEEWQEEGDVTDKHALYARRESYPHSDSAVIPQRGLFLTAAVDVQDNPPRLEVEVKAWGRGRENWSMGYWVLQDWAENGELLPVSSRSLWLKLHELLERNWTHASGHSLPILIMTIDTGRTPKPVYEFARWHPQLHYSPGTGIRLHAIRTVVPIKGNDDELRIISGISKEDAARQRQGVRIVSIGTHCTKSEIFPLLAHVTPHPEGIPVHGCYHFPMYDMSYFEGITAEVRVVDDKGKVEYVKRGPRNEPVDLAVYNRAASALVGIDRFGEVEWRQLEAAVAIDPSQISSPATTPNPTPVPISDSNPVVPTPLSPPSPPPPLPPPLPPPPHPGFSSRRVRGTFL